MNQPQHNIGYTSVQSGLTFEEPEVAEWGKGLELAIAQCAPFTMLGLWKDADFTPLKKFFSSHEEKVRAEERLRAFEILSTYAMKTKTTEALDLIEKAQKDIITPTTEELKVLESK